MHFVDLLDIHASTKARMSPTLNRSSAIRHFKRSNANEIRYGITFDFYTGLPHIHAEAYLRDLSDAQNVTLKAKHPLAAW